MKATDTKLIFASTTRDRGWAIQEQTKMLMPMGKFEGQPVETMSTSYLMWVLSNDHIRFKRWPLIEEALCVLRGRFESFDCLLVELKVDAPPPAYWKTTERTEEQEKARAEKLRQLEQRRLEDRLSRREAWRIAREQADMQRIAAQVRQRFGKATSPAKTEPPANVPLDAAYFVRQARQQRQAESNDISDLI